MIRGKVTQITEKPKIWLFKLNIATFIHIKLTFSLVYTYMCMHTCLTEKYIKQTI